MMTANKHEQQAKDDDEQTSNNKQTMATNGGDQGWAVAASCQMVKFDTMPDCLTTCFICYVATVEWITLISWQHFFW